MNKVTIEICCVSLQDCMNAEHCGANRIELCASMAAGGLTPSMAVFQLAKAAVKIPIMVMIRPRGAGFCYDDIDFQVMRKDIQLFLEAGGDGAVFGILDKHKQVDVERTKQLVELIHHYGKEAVFHRAIDECVDKDQAIQALIACGVDRILSAGGQGSAMVHIEELKRWQEVYGSQVQFQTCGTIRSDNIREVVESTKINQVHSACRMFQQDASDEVSDVLGYHNAYDLVCKEACFKLVEKVRSCIVND